MAEVKVISTNKFDVVPNLKELNNAAEEAFKKDRFMIAPAGATFKADDKCTYSPVSDPCQILVEKMIPTADDMEIMFVSLIGCVPGAGPVLQGVYGCFAARTTKDDSLTKEQINERITEKMDAFKVEMNKIIDDKIEASEAKQYKVICDNAFNGLVNSSLEMLMNHLTELRKKYLRGDDVSSTSSIITSIQGLFRKFRLNIKELFPLFRDPKVVKVAYNQFIQMTFMYVMCLRHLMCYWHQYAIPPEQARGTPFIEGVAKETHSFRQKLHLNIHKNLKVLQDNLNGNEKDLKNLDKLLESDPILYPIALVRAPVVVPPNDYHKRPLAECYKLSIPTKNVDVGQRETPFILRVDGIELTGEPRSESISARPRPLPTTVDPVTNCTGAFINGYLGIKFKLSQKKYVSFRIFVAHNIVEPIKIDPNDMMGFYGYYQNPPANDCKVSTNFDEFYSNKFDYESGSLKDPAQSKTIKTGFYITKKSPKAVDEIELSVQSDGRLLFVELVISDE